MKKYTNLWQYLTEFFLDWEIFRLKHVQKIKTHMLCVIFFFFQKSCRLWDNVKKYGTGTKATDDDTVRRLRWLTNATQTHSEYVILIAFSRQQWFRECSSVLCLLFKVLCNSWYNLTLLNNNFLGTNIFSFPRFLFNIFVTFFSKCRLMYIQFATEKVRHFIQRHHLMP
jgi:hypothetical protein